MRGLLGLPVVAALAAVVAAWPRPVEAAPDSSDVVAAAAAAAEDDDGPAQTARRRLVDIDGDGNEDQFNVADARTSTPTSTEYEAHFHKVIDAYGCGPGYFGFGCAKRLCAFGASWTVDGFLLSDPSDDLYTPWGRSDQAGMHSYQECAGKGMCNRDTGKCSCFGGYHGKGCRYKACPNNCGEHGVCQPNYVLNPDYTAAIPEVALVWDRERSFRCVCDYGYTGIDCSDRICPQGLDPVNAYAVNCDPEVDRSAEFFGWDQQVIRVPTTMPDDQWLYLEFETAFAGKALRTHPIHFHSAHISALAGDIQQALERLPNQAVPTVQTRVLDNDAGDAATVLVAFTDPTMPGRQQLLSCVAPSTTGGSACASGTQPMIKSLNVAGVECETDYYNDESEIYTAYECSARGECDRSNGKCVCHSGFSGLRCEQMFSFF